MVGDQVARRSSVQSNNFIHNVKSQRHTYPGMIGGGPNDGGMWAYHPPADDGHIAQHNGLLVHLYDEG